MGLVILFDIFLNHSLKITKNFTNIARNRGSTMYIVRKISNHELKTSLMLKFSYVFIFDMVKVAEIW